MNDEDLERLLQRYEPAGPPDVLRERVLTPPLDARRAWPWLVAASVLLCITIGAQTASIHVRREFATLVNPEPADAELQALEEALGGGPEARRIAERMMIDRALDLATERPVGTAGTIP
jgi:hypothetical protein